MADLHALIRRMADELDHYRQLLCDDRTERHPLATEARAALAAEPQGDGPTDDEVDAWADDNDFVQGHGDHPCGFWVKDDDLGKIVRLALARWGRPAPPLADDGPAVPEGREPASVEQQATADELLRAYQAGRRDAEADERWAADVAQDLPADGEVRELVEGLRLISDGMSAIGHESDSWFVARAADILTRLALKPVPVSERLPGPGDCIPHPRRQTGLWCWGLEAARTSYGLNCVWRLMELEDLSAEATSWLPAHALPLPASAEAE